MGDQGPPQEQYYIVEKVTGRGYERSGLSWSPARVPAVSMGKRGDCHPGARLRALGVGEPPFTPPFGAELRCLFPGGQEISRVQYHHSLQPAGVEPESP